MRRDRLTVAFPTKVQFGTLLGNMSSPFPYDSPVVPSDLIDRDTEAATLVERALAGRNTRLVAPRRYGKTSLARRVLVEVEDDRVGVYVNFFGVLTVDDIAERFERAYREQLRGRLARWFGAAVRTMRPVVRAGGGALPASVELTPGDRAGSLLDRLSVPRLLHERHETRFVIVLDEFQDVLRAGQRVDATIRSEIEHHGDAVAYVFAGSHPGLMTELFSDRRRAFYAQATPVELDILDPMDVAEFVGGRFEAGGRDPGDALGPLLDLAAGHPQRLMLLADHLWRHTPPGAVADAETWGAVLHSIGSEVSDELEAVWRGLPATQQGVLTAVADDTGALFSASVLLDHGLRRGGGTSTALRALVDTGTVVRDDRRATRHRVVDPLLALWLRAGRRWPI